MSIIFANFWTWIGAVILVGALFDGVQETVRAAKRPERHIRMTTYGDGTCILEIDSADDRDVRRAVEAVLGERGGRVEWGDGK